MDSLERLAQATVRAYKNGNQLLIAGNGGSAAQSDHLATELVGMYKVEDRRALPAISLSASSAIITSLANDKGYEDVFARQVEAYGKKGDILLVLTTSDYSENHSNNLPKALIMALSKDMITAGLVSEQRTEKLNKYIQIPVLAKGETTADIQENHLRMIHELSDRVEREFV